VTWTYHDNPLVYEHGTYNLDLVRLLLGDFDESNQLLDDEALELFMSEETSPYVAAARGAESIAGEYAGKVRLKIGDVQIRGDQIAAQFTDLAALLRMRAYTGIKIYVGGLNAPPEAAKPDHVRKFKRDMHVDRNY